MDDDGPTNNTTYGKIGTGIRHHYIRPYTVLAAVQIDPRVLAAVQINPGVLAAVQIDPRVLAGVQIDPRVLAGVQIDPRVLAGVQIDPKLLTAVQIDPRVLAGVQIKPGVLVAVQIDPKLLAAVQIDPRVLAAVQIKPGVLAAVQIKPGVLAAVQIDPRVLAAVQIDPRVLAAVQIDPRVLAAVQIDPRVLAGVQIDSGVLAAVQIEPRPLCAHLRQVALLVVPVDHYSSVREQSAVGETSDPKMGHGGDPILCHGCFVQLVLRRHMIVTLMESSLAMRISSLLRATTHKALQSSSLAPCLNNRSAIPISLLRQASTSAVDRAMLSTLEVGVSPKHEQCTGHVVVPPSDRSPTQVKSCHDGLNTVRYSSPGRADKFFRRPARLTWATCLHLLGNIAQYYTTQMQ
uniref:Uncharacterized protein n=1 Tax=Timema poppense TaxID=170557 RepID=A0A7R9DK08_TIMPO|nr:unnamed protein product [Timema poppensis]